MKKLKTFISRVAHVRALKYIVTTVLAVILVGFVDENSIWRHLRNKQRIDDLQTEIKKYSDQHQHNQMRIDMLDSDPKAIEKIARERYFMKADDEDIFVLSDDNRSDLFADADETAE